MKLRILATMHLIGMALTILRLCFVPFENHLRYGTGHTACWIIVITAVLAFFCVPQTIFLRKWVKRHLRVYLFDTCFMALYPLAIVILFIMATFVPEGWRLWVVEDCFVQALVPKPIECENATYVIRKWEDVNYTDNNERFYLYRKASLVEHLISICRTADIGYEKGYARRILEVNENKGVLRVEADVYADYDFARTEVQEWEINKEETE